MKDSANRTAGSLIGSGVYLGCGFSMFLTELVVTTPGSRHLSGAGGVPGHGFVSPVRDTAGGEGRKSIVLENYQRRGGA